ncbi:hypothetical protein [Scytonema sp. PRP1]|uniref:hypothetical protein n=1 Tax=Scytonema sp. PRP1 TaxID=3120513 RepID=UPI002FCEEA4C
MGDWLRQCPLGNRTLAFENYFLERYKMYLLGELQYPSDMYQLYAIKRLRQIIYHERAVLEALEALKNPNSKEIQLQVDATLQRYAFLYDS